MTAHLYMVMAAPQKHDYLEVYSQCFSTNAQYSITHAMYSVGAAHRVPSYRARVFDIIYDAVSDMQQGSAFQQTTRHLPLHSEALRCSCNYIGAQPSSGWHGRLPCEFPGQNFSRTDNLMRVTP